MSSDDIISSLLFWVTSSVLFSLTVMVANSKSSLSIQKGKINLKIYFVYINNRKGKIRLKCSCNGLINK